MIIMTVIHVFLTKKKCITERVFILVNKLAVNMTNFIHEYLPFFKPLNDNSTKWSNTLKQFVGKLPANILSVVDHFVGLALKGFRNKGHWRKKWFVDLIYFSHIQFHQENYWSYDKICDFVNDISQDGISLKSLDHAGCKC